MKTRLVILAASAQPGGRCVAGKTMDARRWVRPVAGGHGDGVPDSRLALECGGTAAVGDIVEMALLDQNPKSDHQTENRLMADSPWKKTGRARYRDLSAFVDSVPGPLWQNGESTQFGENNCVSNPLAQEGSLRLFRAQDVKVEWVSDGYDGPRHRPYAVFRLNNSAYRIRVTDRREHSPWERPIGNRVDCLIPDCFVCVSLTQKFSGDNRCHKLIACIIEPERLP